LDGTEHPGKKEAKAKIIQAVIIEPFAFIAAPPFSFHYNIYRHDKFGAKQAMQS